MNNELNKDRDIRWRKQEAFIASALIHIVIAAVLIAFT